MKKVININFQGRVIPIEETAYELLKQYVESLRQYFAHEEGRDEIINDIEGRIAELFSERLKKGISCIADDDVKAVIASMGRPEDFEAEASDAPGPSPSQTGSEQQQQSQSYTYATTPGRGRLYRNADDKILGGVCSGLANYFGIDPVIMRIAFVVFFAALFWVYLVLWIVVPSKSVNANITKRLYRSADDRVIGGVCGGLAAYFNISPWVPRLIFALPLIITLISGPFHYWWGDWNIWWGPRILTGSLSSTLFVTYIILWIAVPVATSAAEKLEMRGEKVDVNSIRNTVKEDIETFKQKAQGWGNEVKESAQQLGRRAKVYGDAAGARAKSFAAETGPVAREAGRGAGHILGVLVKAFFLFIGGIILLSLCGVLFALLMGSFAAFPVKDFILQGFWQNLMAWGTLVLFLMVPLVALITWLIRRIMGVRSKTHFLGFVFGGLWVIGLLCAIFLSAMVAHDFRTRSPGIAEPFTSFTQPGAGKLYVDVAQTPLHYYGDNWFGVDWGEWPAYGLNRDSALLNTIRVNIVQSRDSGFHVYRVRFSRGNSPEAARRLAERIKFDISQNDSVLLLPRNLAISTEDKFRNQQVLVVVEVPIGKKIQVNRRVNGYDWFNIEFNHRRGWNMDWDDNWNHTYYWQANREYMMTKDNLEQTDKPMNENDNDNQVTPSSRHDHRNFHKTKTMRTRGGMYRYNPARDSAVKAVGIRYEYDNANTLSQNQNMNIELSGPISVSLKLF